MQGRPLSKAAHPPWKVSLLQSLRNETHDTPKQISLLSRYIKSLFYQIISSNNLHAELFLFKKPKTNQFGCLNLTGLMEQVNERGFKE